MTSFLVLLTMKSQRRRQLMSEENYMSKLSKVVGEACDRWLASRGFEKKGWKKQNDEFFARNKNNTKTNNGND